MLRRALELELLARPPPCASASSSITSSLRPSSTLTADCDVLRVVLARDQPDAWRGAAPDLVLQARPAAVGEEAVAAVADAEQLLQLLQASRAPRRRSGYGPK